MALHELSSLISSDALISGAGLLDKKALPTPNSFAGVLTPAPRAALGGGPLPLARTGNSGP